MTVDVRNELERAAAQAPAPSLEFDHLRRRRDRQARTRKAGVMVVALGIAAALIVALVTAAGTLSRPTSGAADGGTPHAFPVPSGLQMGPDDVFYQENDVAPLPGLSGPASTSSESDWWRLDGSGRTLEGANDDRWGAGTRPIESYATLSTNSDLLLTQLLHRTAPDGASPEPCPGLDASDTGCLFGVIHGILLRPNATPELRAALFRVAADLPGVDVTMDAVDPAGRATVELSFTENNDHLTLWFDPTTQQLTAEKNIAPGTAGNFQEIVRRAGLTSSLDSTDLRVVFVPAAP